MSPGPGDGFDAPPEEIRATAAAARGDAELTRAAGVAAGAAARSAAAGAGCFAPLTGALARLQEAVQSRSARLGSVVELGAAALHDSAWTYETKDQSVAGTVNGLEFGWLIPPGPGGR